MATPTLAQYELFEAAETGDVAKLAGLFAQPAALDAALALEARITDDALLDPTGRIAFETAHLPMDAWVYLHDRRNHIFRVAAVARQYEIMEWLFMSPLSDRLLRTLQFFLEDIATITILGHDVGILELLLASRAWTQHPDTARIAFLSALVKAGIQTHRLSILTLLVAHGADINQPLAGNGSPISYVAARDAAGTVAYFLRDHGAFTVGECSALNRAAEYGQRTAIRVLVDLGVDPRACNGQFDTPLHRAAEEGYYATIATLFENACLDIDAQNDEGNTALNLAVQTNPYSDGDEEDEEDEEELEYDEHHASHARAIDVLLQHGADPSICSCGQFDRAPLHWAVRMQSMDVVRTLLTCGADPNVRTTTRQQTPAHLLAEDTDLSIDRPRLFLELLVAHGADLTCKDADNVTPLDLASSQPRCCGLTGSMVI